MTLTEILAECRGRLGDTRAPYLWSDGELVGYLNETINEAAEKAKLFRDSTTAAICQITVHAADLTQDYALDSRILEIYSAKLSGQSLSLRRRTKAEMDALNPDWRNETASTPWAFLTDYSESYITLHPKSNLDGILYLSVLRLPLTQMSLTTTPVPSLEIPFRHHPRLLNGMMSRAYLKEDSQTLDPQKAAEHLTLWRADINEMAKGRIKLHATQEVIGPEYGAI
jgi:hypothetical protein